MFKAPDAAGGNGACAARPAHVAIIMDGNGRWAQRRGLPRLAGHRRGVETVRAIVEACPALGVRCLTLYAFSTENWRRSEDEVRGLMNLFRVYIRKEGRALARQGARVRFLGDRRPLDADLVRQMALLEEATAGNERLSLNIALNYGGRAEILAAARRLAREAAAGRLDPEALDDAAFEARFADALHTRGLPDPDLVIRTSGEMRISNFLVWQAAYAELAFVDECWPDFTPELFARTLEGYGRRERRFGAVGAAGA
ncbi:polyprenyl diphosphate synthase [Oceanicella actignis]|uniref:polyprenyl diphosphate synthase n=1 Tax=Oceanicella actignis TaxID=1189325 RepID=UPI0011E7BACE|nr:polyprenyl diphosphate synthase [Oceanicella actignis]TYO85004.1 undecaprenyl diphosphate synthase [Oceanicella actignis]